MVMLCEFEQLPRHNYIQHPLECLLLAQSRHPDMLDQCSLSGVTRTSCGRTAMSVVDPNSNLIFAKSRQADQDALLRALVPIRS